MDNANNEAGKADDFQFFQTLTEQKSLGGVKKSEKRKYSIMGRF